MHVFVISKDESTLEVALAVRLETETFMRIKKKRSVTRMQLESIPHSEEEEEDEEEITITKPRSARKIGHPSTSLANTKRKGVAASPEKEKKKSKEPRNCGDPKEEEETPQVA